jgi:hypothetical protein
MKMKILRVVIEKTSLLQKKEEVTARIYLSATEGKVIIEIPDPKLESKLREYIGFSNDYIKAQAILQETSIISQIKESLLGRKLDGAGVVKEISIYEL